MQNAIDNLVISFRSSCLVTKDGSIATKLNAAPIYPIVEGII